MLSPQWVDEPMKRKKKSKHGSKKAAKKGHRSQPSQPPEVDEYELDMEGVPRDKLERTLTAMHRVNQGLKASSDRAESAVSGMTRMIGRLTRARDDERGWLREENRILKDLVGWKKSGSRVASPPPSSSEEETASLEEDEMRRQLHLMRKLGTPDFLSGLKNSRIPSCTPNDDFPRG